MEFKQAVEKVEASEKFEGTGILSYGLKMSLESDWQVGFVSDSLVTVYTIHQQGVMKQPASRMANTSLEVLPVDLDKVIVPFADVYKKIDEIHSEYYPAHPKMKSMVIVQQEASGPVYNCTLFTTTLQTINMRFDASSGEVISHDIAVLAAQDQN